MHHEQIKAELRIAGTSPAMLADELGISQSSISAVVRGVQRSQRVMGRIAQIIEKPVDEIWPPKPSTGLRRQKSKAVA